MDITVLKFQSFTGPLFQINNLKPLSRLCSKKNCKQPSALCNPGCLAYDLYLKKKLRFSSCLGATREQSLGAKGPWVLLEHSLS